ncbi:MAG: 3D domain-containing protein [Gaiellaceae bacterium]
MGPRFRRICAAAVIAVAGAAGLPASSLGDDPDDLRQTGAALAAQERSATLELYALETRLARARAELAALQARAADVARERRSVSKQLGAARATLAASERFLGLRLRTLYEEGQTDPIAIIFGAESLQEAINDLDNLEFAAEQDREIIERTLQGKKRLGRLGRTLDRRRADLARLTREAESRAASLADALAARRSYLAELRAERGANAARLAEVQAQVQTAREQTERLAAPTTVPAPAPGNVSGRRMTVISTAYALPGFTATGIPVGYGVVAVDPSVIPLGTRMTIPGYGEGIAADTGSAVKGAKIDVWLPTRAKALAWGVRTVTITLH